MDPAEVAKLIEAGLPGCQVTVNGDGSHFEAIVVGEVFAGLSLVKQQQLVYATVVDRITSGELHALSIKTYTPQDWERAKKLQVSS
jgi:acid stress-induced BolA-like protein IbaG/YrbA